MSLFAETGLTQVLFLGARSSSCLLMRSNRYFNRRSQSQEASFHIDSPVTEQKGHHLEAPAPMIQWEVQMHETARELSGQLDTKLGLLQQLIREADRVAARLEAALAAARTQAAQRMPSQDAGANDTAQHSGQPWGRSRPVPTAGEGSARRRRSRQAKSRDPPVHGLTQPPRRLGECSRQHRFQEIYTLADYGLDAAEIAQPGHARGRSGTDPGCAERSSGKSAHAGKQFTPAARCPVAYAPTHPQSPIPNPLQYAAVARPVSPDQFGQRPLAAARAPPSSPAPGPRCNLTSWTRRRPPRCR